MNGKNISALRRYVQPTAIAAAILVAAALWFINSRSYSSHVVINEVSFSGNDGNDWIELYNPSLNSVSLKNYYLSDNINKLTKYKFEDDVVVPTRGFVIIFGENHDNVSTGVEQLSFNVGNGETIFLTGPDGETIVDRLTVIDDKGKTVGRFPDGREDVFTFSTPTPGSSNDKDEW